MLLNFNMTPKYAKGGIGDLLLCLQSAIEEKKIQIYSHFFFAPDIFIPFGVEIVRFDFFSSMGDLANLFISGDPLPIHQHPNFTLPNAPFRRPDKKIIGIHIEGSSFSNNFWEKVGMPSKNMTHNFLIKLVKVIQSRFKEVAFYIFCHPSRSREIGQLLAPEIIGDYFIIAFPEIWKSLACVKHCDFVIGMDSAIKTMSSILYIPTLTLVGDYSDQFRDERFLTPYVIEGTMNLIYFKNIEEINLENLVEYIRL